MSSELLEELDASSGVGEAPVSRGGVGGWTINTAGGATGSADTTREMVAGGDEVVLVEPVAMMTDRRTEEGLRGMRGRGAPA